MRIHAYIPPRSILRDLLGSAADETRLRILAALEAAPDNELCVCELVDALREPQYNVSRHLRILSNSGLVAERPEGRWVHYRLTNNRRETRALLAFLREVGGGTDRGDRARLRRRLALRRGGACVLGVQDPALLSRRRSRAR